MIETTPPPDIEYAELVTEYGDGPPPILDRPVLVTVDERIPVDVRIPGSWVAAHTIVRPGSPVQIAGDHPARVLWKMVSYAVSGVTFVLSHSAETCTAGAGMAPNAYELSIRGRGSIWAAAFFQDPESPDPEAHVRIDWFAEFL